MRHRTFFFFNKSESSLEWDHCRGPWQARLEAGREGRRGTRASGLGALTYAGEAYVQMGGLRLFWNAVKALVRACFPQAGSHFWISHTAVSNKHGGHPLPSKTKSEWLHSLTASGSEEQRSRFGGQFGSSLNVKYKFTIWPRNSTPGNPPKKNGNTCLHADLYVNAESSPIHDSRKGKELQGPATSEQIHCGISIQWDTIQRVPQHGQTSKTVC